jgi:hypothetical protein
MSKKRSVRVESLILTTNIKEGLAYE